MADLFGNPFSNLSGGSIGDQASTRSSFGPSNTPTGFIGQPFSGGSIGDQPSNNSGFGFFPVFNNTPGGGNVNNPFLVNQAGAGRISANTGGNPFALRPNALAGRTTAFGTGAFDPFGGDAGYGDGGGGGYGEPSNERGTAVDDNIQDFIGHVGLGLGLVSNPAVAIGKIGFEAMTGVPFGLNALSNIAAGRGAGDDGHSGDIDAMGGDFGAPAGSGTGAGFGSNADEFGGVDPDGEHGVDDPGVGHDVGMDAMGNDDTGNGASGPDGDGDCVIASHALASGAFTRRDRATAVAWCRKHLHGSWIGEAFRRGYRWHGSRAIERGRADKHYDEFRRFVAFVTGKERTLGGAWIVAKRAIQFTTTGLLVR